MFCGLLALSIITFQFVACNRCCKNHQCTLIDNETLCVKYTSRCHWTDGACVGNACADYDYEKSCYGPHDTGVYTDVFYCKWENGNCVAGTGDCSNYDNSPGYCLKSGKCRHNGTNCLSASSCSDFSESLYISNCDGTLIINGSRCHQKDGKCKDFACSDLDAAEAACNAEGNCYWGNSVCATVTSCSLLSSEICERERKKDSAGNNCTWINDKCRKWDCGNFDEETDCVEGRGLGRCNWPSEKCAERPDVDCNSKSIGGPESCNDLGCFHIKKCPVDPTAVTDAKSTSMICTPGLFMAFLIALLFL